MSTHPSNRPGPVGGADPLALSAGTTHCAQAGSAALESRVPTAPATTARTPRRPRRGRVHLAYERGMATAEYAVGILAAVALALVLLRIITDNNFFSRLLRIVLQILERVGAMIGS